MKNLNASRMIILIVALFGFTQIYADTIAHTAVDNNTNTGTNADMDTSTQTGWQKQNANIAAEEANTAAKNADTKAQTAETVAKMVTPVPAPKEIVAAPAGFVNCFIIKEGWFNGVWVPEHRVCQYNPSNEGVAWIEGYWACTQYNSTGKMNSVCTNWDWKPGRWVKTLSVY